MAIAGRVAIVPKGDWSADATYKRLDAVTYNNTLYFAKKEVPAGTVTSNTEYWSKSIVGGVGTIAKPEEAGIVKPDGKSMSVDESGTLSINLDGTTITLDEAKNVIKLADTLKDAINGAFPAANVANNQITTVEGFALDARQANPNLDGTLAKQISDLNGSLNLYCEAIMTPNYAYSEEFTWKFYKCGRIVTVITNTLRDIPTGADFVLFDNIPNEFIPMSILSFRMYDINTRAAVEVTFYTSGKVLVRNYTGNASSGYNIGGNILYVSKEV